ncbi:MAG: hypothetical protein IJI22_01575 [Bacilli bacterium]|nr:hypothetical protein [Bacilli bacterium]
MDKYSNLEISKNLRKYMTALMARADITSRCFGKEMLDFNRYLYEPETKIPENYTISSINFPALYYRVNMMPFDHGTDFFEAYNINVLYVFLKQFCLLYDEHIAYINIGNRIVMEDSCFDNPNDAKYFSQDKRLLYLRNCLAHYGGNNSNSCYLDKNLNLHIKNDMTSSDVPPFEITLDEEKINHILTELTFVNYFDFVYFPFLLNDYTDINDDINNFDIVRLFSKSKSIDKFSKYFGKRDLYSINKNPFDFSLKSLSDKSGFEEDPDLYFHDYTANIRRDDLKKQYTYLINFCRLDEEESKRSVLVAAMTGSMPIAFFTWKRYLSYNHLIANGLCTRYDLSLRDLSIELHNNVLEEFKKTDEKNDVDNSLIIVDNSLIIMERMLGVSDARGHAMIAITNYIDSVIKLDYDGLLDIDEEDLLKLFRDAITHGTWSIVGDDKIRLCTWQPKSKKIDIEQELPNDMKDETVSIIDLLKIADRILEYNEKKEIEKEESSGKRQ